MAQVGQVTLGQVRLEAQQRSDRVNSSYITTPEWNTMISASWKELYDLLITTYGSDYFVAAPFQFTTIANQKIYPLPDGLILSQDTSLPGAPLYKLIGVDLQVTTNNGNGPTSWITLHRFEFGERNKLWVGNTYNLLGYTNLDYKIVGSNLWFLAYPAAGQLIQLWYVPKPPNLQAAVVGSFTGASATVSCSDTSQLAVGMSLDGQGVAPIASNATILSIIPDTSFVMSAVAGNTSPNQIFYAWSDTTTFDGISGWEEFVVLDAAMKAGIKEETDVSGFQMQKAALMQRILDSAPNRDAAEAPRVTDSIGSGYGGGGWGGDGWGGGG